MQISNDQGNIVSIFKHNTPDIPTSAKVDQPYKNVPRDLALLLQAEERESIEDGVQFLRDENASFAGVPGLVITRNKEVSGDDTLWLKQFYPNEKTGFESVFISFVWFGSLDSYPKSDFEYIENSWQWGKE